MTHFATFSGAGQAVPLTQSVIHGIPTRSVRNDQCRSASAEGVGARLARDLARSGSKPCECGLPDTPRVNGVRAAARPIVRLRPRDKLRSHGLRPESKATALIVPTQNDQPRSASAEGVGARLARDLARSGSKPCECGVPDTPRVNGLRAAARPIVRLRPRDKLRSHGLRPESKATLNAVCFCRRRGSESLIVPTRNDQPRSASAEGVGARLARDLARSGSKPCECGVPDTPRVTGLRAAARPIVRLRPRDKLRSHGLRPESEATLNAVCFTLRADTAWLDGNVHFCRPTPFTQLP